MKEQFKIPVRLSFVIMILSIIASIGGLFFRELYNDNTLVLAAWRGNDIITLFIAVPLMAISLYLFLKGSKRGFLIWMGTLWYMLYNYMFYLYGASFNEFFLIYTALFALSGYAFVLGLIKINVSEISKSFNYTKRMRVVSGFMLFFGILLGGIEIAMSLSFVFNGEIPEAIKQVDHPTGVIFATDLSILIPLLIVGGILLWKAQPWGYILSSIALIKASAYGVALIVITELVYRSTGIKDTMMPLWIFLTIGCWICCFILFRNINDRIQKNEN